MLRPSFITSAIALLLATAATEACTTPSEPAQRPAAEITREQARKLAHQKYQDVIAGLYVRIAVPDRYVMFPRLALADFKHVDDLGDAWSVYLDPPAGFTVKLRVSKDGKWVELTEAGFSDE